MAKLCVEHSYNRYLVRGVILTPILLGPVADDNAVSGAFLHEQCCILSGFLWPEIGWEVILMPGFTLRPSLEYRMNLSCHRNSNHQMICTKFVSVNLCAIGYQ